MSGPIPTPVADASPGSAPGRDLTTANAAVRLAIGLATVVAVALVVIAHRAQPAVAGLLSAAVLCYGALSIIDTAQQRLPNRLTLPLAGGTALVVLGDGAAAGDLRGALGSLAVGLVFAFVLALLRFGMGDVKLALTVGTIAGWLGRDAVVVTAYAGALSGAAAALLLIVIHRRRDLTFGFGPFLALGSVAGMVAAGL